VPHFVNEGLIEEVDFGALCAAAEDAAADWWATRQLHYDPADDAAWPRDATPDELADAFGAGVQNDLSHALSSAGFPAEFSQHLVRLAATLQSASGGTADHRGPEEDGGAWCGSMHTDQELVEAADASVVLGRWLADHQFTLLQQMSLTAGRKLLDRDDVASPDELSRTARARWRAETKTALASEWSLLTGRGIQTCHDLVGFALAPEAATAPARRALATGSTDQDRVRAWFNSCRSMTAEDAATVSAAVFAASGRQGTARQSDKQFKRLLHREVARINGKDPAAERARRQQARDDRHLAVRADDDGTASLNLLGPLAAVIGAADRIDTIARRARASGEQRTIAQLRFDAAAALLLHGALPASGQHTAPAPADHANGDARSTSPGARGAIATAGRRPSDAADEPLVDLTMLEQAIAGIGPVQLDVIVPLEALLDPQSDAVAELPRHGVFITAEHARELALAPGTTMNRILTDPTTGVCVERSISTYRPDAAMRAHITALDLVCRAPGCTVPAALCQLDHVTPYAHDDPASGGRTAIDNLAPAHTAHHHQKTRGLVEVLMDRTTRQVTWRTLFGRIYNTYPHDYAQYTGASPSEAPPGRAGPADEHEDRSSSVGGTGDAGGSPPEWPAILDNAEGPDLDDPDARDRLIYAALTERAICDDGKLAGWDDYEGADAADVPGYDYPFTEAVDLIHHTPGGARRRGPARDYPTTHELLHPRDTNRAVAEAERAKRDREDQDRSEPPPF
jgi:hypothetical protein